MIGVVTGNSQSGFSCIKALIEHGTGGPKILAMLRSTDDTALEKFQAQFPGAGDLLETVGGIDARVLETLIPAFSKCQSLLIVTPLADDRGALTRSMIRAAKASKTVENVVLVSSWTVETKQPTPVEEFGLSEQLGQELFPNHFATLRCGYFMSNILDHVEPIKAVGKIHLPIDAEAKIAFVDPDDIGYTAAYLLKNPSFEEVIKIVNVSGPETFSFNEISKIIGDILGKEVQYVQISLEHAIKFLAEKRGPQLAQFVKEIVPFVNRGMAMQYPDVFKLTGRKSTVCDYLRSRKHLFQ